MIILLKSFHKAIGFVFCVDTKRNVGIFPYFLFACDFCFKIVIW